MYEISDDTRRSLALEFFQFTTSHDSLGRDDIRKLEIEHQMAMREYLDLERTPPDSADILIPAWERAHDAFRKFIEARQKYLDELYDGNRWSDIVSSRNRRYTYPHG